MLCPICGRPTRLLRTEPLEVGAVRHVRLCTIPTSLAHPHVEFETVEVLAATLSGMGAAALARELHRARKGLRRRVETETIRRKTLKLLAAGKRTAHVARAVGITEARVRQIRAEAAAVTVSSAHGEPEPQSETGPEARQQPPAAR
jgi:uroporphyrinogen-III synthase